MTTRTQTILLFTLILPVPSSQSEELIQVGRYSTLQPGAEVSEQDPLQAVTRVTFPQNIERVSQAIEYLLLRSGYRFTEGEPMLPVLLNAPLPRVHQSLGPITLEQALMTLAGPAWHLVLDPVHRYLSYELKLEYRGTLNGQTVSTPATQPAFVSTQP